MAILETPGSFQGDEGTPHFRAISSLSPAVNRKIEPFGAAFLAHARRQRHGRTFSEDDRIQALAKVKKTEDSDDGDISEPEDPLMLQRDAKDWKVSSVLISFSAITNNYRRDKIITPSSACPNTASVPPMSRLRRPTARRC